jgi:hypothetical protein
MIVLNAWRARNGIGRSVMAPLLGMEDDILGAIEDGNLALNGADRYAIGIIFDDAVPAVELQRKFDPMNAADGALLDMIDAGFARWAESVKLKLALAASA